MHVRELGAHEVEHALALTRAEGWVFDRPEFERLLRVGACLVLESDAGLAGLLTSTDYPRLSWIGNVVVTPALRGRGHGETLVRAAVLRAEKDLAQATVALYSVPKAVGLYARLGFRRTGAVVSLGAERARPPAAAEDPGIAPLEAADLDDVARLDRSVVGFDRSDLLRELAKDYPETAVTLRRDGRVVGFAFAKPARNVSEVGPVVAPRADDQRALLAAALARVEGPVEAAVPRENAAALEALASWGFVPAFEAPVMVRGADVPTEWRHVAAVGGLEKG